MNTTDTTDTAGASKPAALGLGPALGPGPRDTWRALPAGQQPAYPDPAALRRVTDELAGAPPLVLPGECDRLRDRLAAVARGEALLLQGGDCAETFDRVSVDTVHSKLNTLMQMSAVLTYAVSMPVVKVGRLAGQYAKPRSKPTESRDGVTLPVYRGDAVNGPDFTHGSRVPDPERLLRMYQASSHTLNLVRAFTASGRAGLSQVHEWNRDFIAGSPLRARYEGIADGIDRAMNFMRATGARPQDFDDSEFFVSHEGLLLDYESPLTRRDRRTGRSYATSGHMLWIGERTRDLDGAHVEYFSRIDNPIGVKLGPATTADTALQLIDRLDPDREPGRLTFVVRLGVDRVREVLPPLVEKVTASGAQVVWACDPMHGNTLEAPSGHKTRRFDDILGEVRGFFEVHRALGTHPGGIHVELTGDDVTECLGGGHDLGFPDLFHRYESACDPRLNRGQSLDLAFLVAGFLDDVRPVLDGLAV
ncbi:3-deoxy-7-phosphoheptulonate synthase class II [Streptomyces phaeofaciens JCM 4814]|uniref:Phospho-2-dehydro-3-deoxyheptonate aldolase n=1 Tax=Streptomyces phaeofaciens TaxID=68254 RepID=A0A918HJV8_9ACTN|nr:3-deoxy-7-phosphoheptulonate synthase class II [Streptomyces phaeofaciens]GGT66323.1 phospho-2-dehydro-3-deoxyheptonate aldolase [Streptomyces phaeofaciens]